MLPKCYRKPVIAHFTVGFVTPALPSPPHSREGQEHPSPPIDSKQKQGPLSIPWKKATLRWLSTNQSLRSRKSWTLSLPKLTWDSISVPFPFSHPSRVGTRIDILLLGHLSTNPLRTKAITSGALSALQEFLASYIAGEKSPDGTYFTNRVPKMAFYGVWISNYCASNQ